MNAPTKQVTYNRENQDYDVFVAGEYRGSRSSRLDADALANSVAYELLQVAEVVTAEVATAEVVEVAPTPAPARSLRAAVSLVLSDARAKLAEDTKWVNALNKAATELEGARWAWNGHTLRIASRTSKRFYRVENGRCECQAAQRGATCWHKAAYGLLSRATRQAVTVTA